MEQAQRIALRDWLCGAAGAEEVAIAAAERLSGGAIQQNWLLTLDVVGSPWFGRQEWVLRMDSPSGVADSRSRGEEFSLLCAAWRAGVPVPRPLFHCAEKRILGQPFFVMQRVPGIAQAHRVVRSDALGGGRERLAHAIGGALARIHAIHPPHDDLDFLPAPNGDGAARRMIADLRARIDAQGTPRPVLEWGLRALERAAPEPGETVLCHNDFRTGNLMVDENGLVAVLDWEFAGWGERMQDIGWFCARCWRFGSPHEAGGIGPREAFYAGYEAQSGVTIPRAATRYWELMATLRWGVIAAEQAARHISGREPSLELALTAHILPELERDILALVDA
jgi:aminoglycoside phosphotransferase (APT) family kinase protein